MDIWGTFFFPKYLFVIFQRKQKWFWIVFVGKGWEEKATKILLNTYFIAVLKVGGKLFIN